MVPTRDAARHALDAAQPALEQAHLDLHFAARALALHHDGIQRVAVHRGVGTAERGAAADDDTQQLRRQRLVQVKAAPHVVNRRAAQPLPELRQRRLRRRRSGGSGRPLQQHMVVLPQGHHQQIVGHHIEGLHHKARAARQQPLVLRHVAILKARIPTDVARARATVNREDHARARLAQEALDSRHRRRRAAEAPPQQRIAAGVQRLELCTVLRQRLPRDSDPAEQRARLVFGELE